jgi:hypothetical protein
MLPIIGKQKAGQLTGYGELGSTTALMEKLREPSHQRILHGRSETAVLRGPHIALARLDGGE